PFPPLGAEETVDHFSVALRDEPLPFRLQVAAQIPEVVDLAVMNERRTSVGMDRWLLSPLGRVEDGQSPMTENRASVRREPNSAAVGASPVQRLEGSIHGPRVHGLRRDPSDDAAHVPSRGT